MTKINCERLCVVYLVCLVAIWHYAGLIAVVAVNSVIVAMTVRAENKQAETGKAG